MPLNPLTVVVTSWMSVGFQSRSHSHSRAASPRNEIHAEDRQREVENGREYLLHPVPHPKFLTDAMSVLALQLL